MTPETGLSPQQTKLGDLIKKAMANPAFKARFKADPKAVLKEAGLPVPAGATINVVEDTHDVVWIRIPYHPAGPLSVAELEAVILGFHHADFSGQWGQLM